MINTCANNPFHAPVEQSEQQPGEVIGASSFLKTDVREFIQKYVIDAIKLKQQEKVHVIKAVEFL